MLMLQLLMTISIASCAMSPQDSNPWGAPDSSGKCHELSQTECLAELEQGLIQESDGQVSRDADALTFRIPGREAFVLRDELEDRMRSVRYRYWGQSDQFFLVRLLFYEGQWYGLVRKSDGLFVKIIRGGLPIVSPDGDWVASASQSIYGQRSTIVDVWNIGDVELQIVHTSRAYIETIGIPMLRWSSDDRVEVCWASSSVIHLGAVELSGGEWLDLQPDQQ